jgi:hypothetical protein
VGFFLINVVVLICIGVVLSPQMTNKFQVDGYKKFNRDVESGISDPEFQRELSMIKWDEDEIIRNITEMGKIN